MRADDGAHAARQAVRTVDMGAVVLDTDSAGRALFGAHTATDAARVADLTRDGALVGVVAAHQDVLVTGNEGDHALWTRHAAQAAARALGAIYAGDTINQRNGAVGAGRDAGAAANAAFAAAGVAACGGATASAGNVGHVMLNGFGHKRLAYFLRRYG